MNRIQSVRPSPANRGVALCRRLAAGLVLLALGACSALSPAARPPPAFYALEAPAAKAGAATPSRPGASTRTLVINPPQAAAGFDSQRIIYVREPHRLDYFAHSEWVEAPARMLGPLLVAAIERTGAFRAVVLTPGAASGEWRLDTEILRLEQDFQTRPSRVRFVLRATLVDDRTRRVIAAREFESTFTATSDDPYGGVVAANRAVQGALGDLSLFLSERPQ